MTDGELIESLSPESLAMLQRYAEDMTRDEETMINMIEEDRKMWLRGSKARFAERKKR